MSKIDINELYTKFYNIVNNMIYDIHSNMHIKKYLFRCKYIPLNFEENYDLPLTICLGGGGFIQYNQIFKNENLIDTIKLESKDYDISFSFGMNNITNTIIIKIKEELENIYNNNIKDFKYNNLTKKDFSFDMEFKNDRLHCRIECILPNKYSFHITEFSLWLNGKISDNFTLNDFTKSKLWLYEKNNIYYYLLPLHLLVKTLLYAIVDYFEKRNFMKCIKYLDRIKFIKESNNLYINSNQNKCLSIIFNPYKNKIKRKYKMIHDYPFIMAYDLKDINNNGIIKCIYRNLRKKNKNIINKNIKEYREKCKDEKNYILENSEMTIEDTEKYDE